MRKYSKKQTKKTFSLNGEEGKDSVVGIHKKFNEELYDKNNGPAIAAVLKHIDDMGLYACVNDDKYGPDVVVYKGFRKSHYIEVEVKRVWKDSQDEFPWNTIQLPERKGKFLKKGLPIEFWIFRSDLQVVVIIPDYAVSSSSLVEVANRLVSAGEYFYQVPVSECNVVNFGISSVSG